MGLSYDKVGASATKSGLHEVLKRVNPNDHQELFCQVFPDVAGDPDYLSFIHCDGAGTKSIAAYLYYKETGDKKYFSRLAQDALVMNLDDIYCLGRPEHLVLANTLARNSHVISDEVIEEIIKGYKELALHLEQLKIPLLLSGGETADCGDIVRTLVVDATMSGRIKKSSLFKLSSIAPGDAIVGLASFGKSTYENCNNSGIGSNGLTLARHALLSTASTSQHPEVLNPYLDKQFSYCGKHAITDRPEILGTTIGDALSSPTRTYAPVLDKIYAEHFNDIKGVIHLTGGAHGKVLRFVSPCKIIKDSLFEPPPIFKLIQEGANISNEEMHRVFNMGQRMEIYCKPSIADQIINISKSFNIEAKVIGRVEVTTQDYPEVIIRKNDQEFSLSV